MMRNPVRIPASLLAGLAISQSAEAQQPDHCQRIGKVPAATEMRSILFLTNRIPIGGTEPPSYYGNDWQQQPGRGISEVAIPKNHKVGIVETPSTVTSVWRWLARRPPLRWLGSVPSFDPAREMGIAALECVPRLALMRCCVTAPQRSTLLSISTGLMSPLKLQR
jgi:hypothetical protein